MTVSDGRQLPCKLQVLSAEKKYIAKELHQCGPTCKDPVLVQIPSYAGAMSVIA